MEMETNEDELLSPAFRLTNVLDNKIVFEEVYYNGFHALQQLEIENLTPEHITIQLDSTLISQLSFQLENENIKDLDLSNTNIATNTSAWATLTATLQDISEFNQVFNYVNHTNELCLNPYQKLQFVVAFLPVVEEGEQQQEQDTTAVFSVIEGSVSFCSNIYTLNVDFEASVCQSILAADELDTGLIFEDSLVGETYIKDVTVRNQSAIDLYWRLNTLDLMLYKNKPSSTSSNHSAVSSTSSSTSNTAVDEWLQFVDASTFVTLDHNQLPPVPPFSYFTFRVIFTPKEVGKFNYDLQIENTNDVRNIIQTKIHATMRTVMHRETLIVSSGSILDFGDCVSGSWNMQQIVLSNISEYPIEIHFTADGGAELGFDVMMKPEEYEHSGDNSIMMNKLNNQNYFSISTSATHLSTKQMSSNDINSSKSSALACGGGNSGHLSPSSNKYSTRPESPTISHKTYGSVEDYSSTNSHASTDVDNIDMLTAYNEVYGAHSNVSETRTTCSVNTQIAITPTEPYNTKIEDMVLKPGVERIIQVSYRPEKDEPLSVNAGQFKRQSFNIILEYRHNKSAKPKELKFIQCKARTCTSFVQVNPHFIDFGDTDVGTQKSLPVSIINQSDICAQVELVFESKVLNCTQGEIIMQPRSSVELKLDIYPRKVNTFYKRQITLVNYLNRDNDQIIEVSSKNMDKHRVTFHSLFYRILTPTGANFLDFGPIALNSPAIRTCTLANIRDTSLLLGVATSSEEEIVIYTKKRAQSRKTIVTPAAIEDQTDKQLAVPSSVTDTLLAKNRRTRVTNVQYTSTAYLDLATIPHTQFSSSSKYKRNIARNIKNGSRLIVLGEKSTAFKKESKRTTKGNITMTTTESKVTSTETTSIIHQQCLKCHKKKRQKPYVGITGTTSQMKKARKKIIDWSDIAGKSRVPLDDLISILEHGSLSRTPLFARQSIEEQFVRYQLAWRTELNRLIEKGELVPTTLLQLNPKEEEEIIVVYSPKTSSQSFTSKNTASISFRLIDYDQSAVITSEEDDDDEEDGKATDKTQMKRRYKDFIPVLRKVIVRAQVCKSLMELGQRNINFGIVDRGDKHHKTIVLHNKSETPLLYTIKKSGSIASGDIHFGVGRHGVIRAFGKREIEFTFEPTLPGSFIEQLEVINIRNKEDRNTISLKAMVRRPESFSIKSSAPEVSFSTCVKEIRQETFVVTNTNKYSRIFEVRVDHDNVQQKQYKAEFFIDHKYQQNETLLLSKEEEEEIENLEQKLKIATRKCQPDKVKKYTKRLAKLRKQNEEGDLCNISSAEETATTEDEIAVVMKQVPDKKGIEEDSITFSLDSNASKSISVCFKVITQLKTNIEGQILNQHIGSTIGSGRIVIYEHKNIDTSKSIPFSVNLCRDHQPCLAI